MAFQLSSEALLKYILSSPLSKSLQNIVNVNTRGKIKKDSDQHSSQSGALIGSNEDLLTEILIRLPATSILRFKSVSKHWHYLLSHSRFTFRFDSLSKSPGLFDSNIYVPFDAETNRSTHPFRGLKHPFGGIRILQSCNGLLLCCTDIRNVEFRNIYVFNPTTKQFVTIPSVPGGHAASKSILAVSLAFHQTACVRYKIVCVSCVNAEMALQTQVYSSDTGKWKISIASLLLDPYWFGTAVYWNGAVHWPPSHGNLLCFETEAEHMQNLPLPLEMTSSTKYFGESRGHLHLIMEPLHDTSSSLHRNVYEMLMDRSGWFVKYHVELDGLPGAYPEVVDPCGYSFGVVDLIRGENEEDTFMVLRIPGKMIRYNIHDKKFKQVSSFPGWFGAHRYIETLSSF